MARGKQKAAAQRRRDAADQASLDRLVAAILSEADKLRAAEQQVAETAGNADLLKARRAARDAAVAGEISRLGPVIAELESAAAEEEDLAERISDAWQGVTDTIMSGYRGGIEGLEDFLADVLDTSDSPMLREGVAGRRLSRERIAALQQARHIRHESFPLHQWDPDAHPVEQWLASQMDAHARSRALGRSWSAMAAWTATVTHDSVGGSALSPFGAVEGSEAKAWVEARPAPDPGEALRVAAAWADVPSIVPTSRWANWFIASPQFPLAADALALRWWYLQACAAEEVASAAETEVEAARSGSFDAPPVGHQAAVWREAATMLASAALYWLPPGQTISYLASQPLIDEDRDDIRLPAAHTMIVPAEPLRLDPRGDEPPDEVYRQIMAASLKVERAASNRQWRVGELPVGRSLSLESLLVHLGASIEAVVLEADRAGRPTKRIVWCLAVPTPTGRAVLARVAVPAWQDRSVWTDALDQLAAVAAWGDWVHPPLDSQLRSIAKGSQKSPPHPASAALVVLDAGRTESHPNSAVGSGRTLAPHTRRGHWRRQHHGPGSEQIKRVRIAPTLVNAGLGPLAPRIYKLPSPPPPSKTDQHHGVAGLIVP